MVCHDQLFMEILLRVGRSSTNDNPSQSTLESTRRRHPVYNPVNWVNTRIQYEGDACALVDLWTSNRNASARHGT